MHLIGWLGIGTQGMANRPIEAFWQGMRELGYVEGQNIILEVRTAEGRLERLPDLAAELLRLGVVLILATVTSATRAAQAATSKVPIVSFAFGDPVIDGFVASLARPGGNITGLSFLGPELVPKCLSLLKDGVPNASRIAILWQPSLNLDPKASQIVQLAHAATPCLGASRLLCLYRALRTSTARSRRWRLPKQTPCLCCRACWGSSKGGASPISRSGIVCHRCFRAGRMSTRAASWPTGRTFPICFAAAPPTSIRF